MASFLELRQPLLFTTAYLLHQPIRAMLHPTTPYLDNVKRSNSKNFCLYVAAILDSANYSCPFINTRPTVTAQPPEDAQLRTVAVLHLPNYTAAKPQPQVYYYNLSCTNSYGGTYIIKNCTIIYVPPYTFLHSKWPILSKTIHVILLKNPLQSTI